MPFQAAGPSSEVVQNHDTAEMLHRHEKMVVALLESASQAILSIDSGGRIVLVNRKTEEMFGYRRDELLGAGLDILLREAKDAERRRRREEFFAEQGIRPVAAGFDLSGRRKD